jgi:hypothetical protein
MDLIKDVLKIPKKSRLQKHQDFIEQSDALRGKGVADPYGHLEPKPLHFPETGLRSVGWDKQSKVESPKVGKLSQHRLPWFSALAAVLIIGIFVTLQTPPAQEMWLTKGGVNIEILAKRDLNTWQLSAGETLRPSDQVQFAVTAEKDTVVYWGISSGELRWITNDEWMWKNKFSLAMGERKLSPVSIELSQESEQEVLHIITCPAKVNADFSDLRLAFQELLKPTSKWPASWSPCHAILKPLR